MIFNGEDIKVIKFIVIHHENLNNYFLLSSEIKYCTITNNILIFLICFKY